MFVRCNLKKSLFIFIYFFHLYLFQRADHYITLLWDNQFIGPYMQTHAVCKQLHIYTIMFHCFFCPWRLLGRNQTDVLINFKYTMLLSARSHRLSKHDRCALTYANKPCPGRSLYCHHSIVYCVTNPSYTNENERCINNASADLTLGE